MAIPDNYIDKITKGNDSRMISPAADMVRVNNDNFDGETLDEVLDDVAEAIGEAGEVKSITVNGQAQTPDSNGNVNIEVQADGLSKEDISVETQGDGTVNFNVKDDTYTINLNHTHENMAKLVVCEESDLPSTLDPATIYAITDSGETEIEKLIIRGMEFAGGGSSTPTYDAEIEYLQATGTQFINTAIGALSNFECEIKAELTENQGIFDTILGACENVSDKIYSIPLAINGSGEFYVQFKDNFAAKSANATGLHVFKSKLINNVVTIDVDGSTASTSIASSAGSITNIDLFLFARNMAGVADRLIKAKIYYCKIRNNGVLVGDFIPVRVGQVGYMYDRVRNRLFGNRGSGNFTLGNDKTT